MVEFPVKLVFETDRSSLKRSQKEAERNAPKAGNDGGGAFAGGVVGGILGNLLSSVKQLFDPLSAIATLLVAALFPILKPFLILFLKVGLLLIKWLNSAVGGLTDSTAAGTTEVDGIVKAGEGLKGGLFLLGVIVAGLAAALLGAPALLVAAVSVLGGLLLSKVGGFFVDMFLRLVQFIDNLWGTNLIEPIRVIFEGITNVFQGLWDIFAGILNLDWAQIKSGFFELFDGLWQILKGTWDTLVEILSTIIMSAWDGLKIALDNAWTFVSDLFRKAFTSVANIIIDAANGLISLINKVPGVNVGSISNVDDAIITPNGDIIRTNPNDFLIATKTPGDFNGGGSGSGATVNVSINGGLITDDVARDIGRVIQRELNLGGRF